jgi:hypothetical protein
MISRRTLSAALCFIAAAVAAPAEDVHIILSGSGGEPEYREQFVDWGARLSAALVKHADADRQNIHWLAERVDGKPAVAGDISRDAIAALFESVAAKLTDKDDLYIYIIGHGSSFSRESKFHIPGPDVTAEDFSEYLSNLSVRRTVMLNSTPASAGFINVLSGPNRVICTATKSAGEFNATQFMEHFIQALEDGSADRNHDERVSFEEVCAQAAQLTAGWYTSEGLIATEHAILDDNGDGLGTRLFNPDAVDLEQTELLDGALAARVYLKDFSFPDTVPQDLIDAYLAALNEVDLWKEKKTSLDRTEYYAGLEQRLLSAARLNRDIRRHMPASDASS